MKIEVLKLIRCPFCGQDLNIGEVYRENDELIDGYIKCECNRFPIIDGILVMKQGHSNSIIIDYLKENNKPKALNLLFIKSLENIMNIMQFLKSFGLIGRLLGHNLFFLLEIAARNGYRFYSDKDKSFFESMGNGNTDDYLKNRFSAESFWPLYPFIPLLRHSKKRILDLSCGAGHSSFIISALVGPDELFCADSNFLFLYLCKKYFSNNRVFICLDANNPLPFKDGIFSSLLMMDAFHYVQNRSGLANEMERIIQKDGMLLLLHLHNLLKYNSAPGYSLTPSSWVKLFRIPVKAIPETTIISDFLYKDVLELDSAFSEAELGSSNAIAIIGSRNMDIFDKYMDLWRLLLEKKGDLFINPLYDIEINKNKVFLNRVHDNSLFMKEYRLTDTYLPRDIILDESFINCMKTKPINLSCPELTEENLSVIHKLMKEFVIINAPKNYY